jgi:hypothetical protein
MLPSLSPQEFVAKRRKVELKERSASHSHFNDLCRLVGHLTPVEADPTGAHFTFETFPFPWPPSHEPHDDPRVQAIARATSSLVAKRDAWLNPEGAGEQELKRRTLTNLPNAGPPGWTWPIASWMRRCWMPTAGRTTWRTRRSWHGCLR